MIGVLFFCYVVAAVLAGWTLHIKKNVDSRNQAKADGKLYYCDADVKDRLLSNNHRCVQRNDVLVDLETKQIVKDYYKETWEPIRNADVKKYGLKGRVVIVGTEPGLIDGVPRYHDEFWVDDKAKRVYILYENLHTHSYYKFFLKRNVPIFHLKTCVVWSCSDQEVPNEIWSKYIDINSKQRLTKEEFEKWDLSKKNICNIEHAIQREEDRKKRQKEYEKIKQERMKNND